MTLFLMEFLFKNHIGLVTRCDIGEQFTLGGVTRCDIDAQFTLGSVTGCDIDAQLTLGGSNKM